MDIQAALLPQECCQQADRAGTRNQRCARLPKGTAPDTVNFLPGFCYNRRWLKENAEKSERGIDLNGIVRLDTPVLRHVTVNLLDAALGILPIAAHVPFTNGAIGAWNWIRPTNDANHELALLHTARGIGLDHATQRL